MACSVITYWGGGGNIIVFVKFAPDAQYFSSGDSGDFDDATILSKSRHVEKMNISNRALLRIINIEYFQIRFYLFFGVECVSKEYILSCYFSVILRRYIALCTVRYYLCLVCFILCVKSK